MKLSLAFSIVLAVASCIGCDREKEQQAIAMTGGDPHRGQAMIGNLGCVSCHTIPGIRNADGLVGPPLNKMGSRMFIGGVVKNTPDNMIKWLQNPPGVDPMTAMPNLHVNDTDARDIACYLYTLR